MSKTKKIIVGASIVAIVGVVAVLSQVRDRLNDAAAQAEAIKCRSQMKQIGFAARMWATDNGGRFPTNFLAMDKLIGSPHHLVCPKDKSNPMRNLYEWSKFDPKQSSYEMLAPGMKDGDQATAYVRCKFHHYTVNGAGEFRE